ncbi:MAG: caspase family protein [Candidatus Symbiothrix sp.]|jgi:hypothetical protein|nr:caspase family protein [Candidatus Symbiothrix sp.]
MKTIFSIIICCLAFQLSGFARTNRALVVAISNYPDHSSWNTIHADNDRKILLPVLRKQGFSEKNISVLKDEQATKKQIVTALQLLGKNAKPGDVVFIHFSCHGQQMEDDNGDEPDGLDESLVPYDAKMFFNSGKYEGENHLRDDELEKYLLAIRKKLGNKGNLIVSLDACHSQSGSRGDEEEEEFVRGTAVIFSRNAGYKGTNTKEYKDVPLVQTNGLSPLTVLSACKSYQNNYEYKADNGIYYGTLTYAICSLDNQYLILTNYIQWLNELKKRTKQFMSRQEAIFETTYLE